MTTAAPAYRAGPVAARVAPTPIGSGISMRKLPPASHEGIASCCDHWLSKARGNYEAPSARWLFMLAHEVKALLAPIDAQYAATLERVRHLEAILLQWNEVFGAPAPGRLASPAALASELRSHQSMNESLRDALQEAREAAATSERRCLETLRQHHDAHRAELQREREQHRAEIDRLRALHASELARAATARVEDD